MQLALVAFLIPASLLAQTGPADARRAFDEAERAAKQQKTAEAIVGYERAVALDPRFAEAWCRLGEIQFNSHDLVAARKSLAAAIQADPDYPAPYVTLASLQMETRDWNGLLTSTERLMQIDPGVNRLNFLYNAVANYNLHNPDAAERSAREAIRLDPGHLYPDSLKVLGEALLQRGDYAGAIAQFQTYLRYAKPGPEKDAMRTRLAGLEKHAETHAGSGADFRTDTELALVRFQFVPRANQPETDLRPEDIVIKEDGVPQKIAVFEGGRFYPRRVPLEITLLFDCSGSVRTAGTLEPHVFETTLLNEYDNVTIAVYAFSDDLVRLTTPTRYAPTLAGAMNLVPKVQAGNTPLFADIAETARQAAANGGNVVRIMVIFSDGQADYYDLGHYEDSVLTAQKLGIALYPVLLQSPDLAALGNAVPSYVFESIDKYMTLAKRTGGESFTAPATRDVLPGILSAIAQQIRYDYVAGFYPTAAGTNKKRRTVEVSLKTKSKGDLIGGQRLIER